MTKKIAVGMSGGVDSSVAAALLKNQGYDVFGIMLRLWSEPGQSTNGQNRCCSPESITRARQVAAMLDIPFYVLDAKNVFHESVVSFFIDKYSAGVTPNPCLECNKNIRWGHLLEKSLAMGASHLATGHYARVDKRGDKWFLLRGSDQNKDQSYALSMIGQKELKHTLFPIGKYTKNKIRDLAKQFDLPVAERQESQDLCFLADRNYRRFMHQYAPKSMKPGPITNSKGEKIGDHKGLPLYTIGQRKGIGISAKEPLYVLEKNMSTNTLIVDKHSKLGKNHLSVNKVNWISGDPIHKNFRAKVQLRYTARAISAWILPKNDKELNIKLDKPINDITPGQAAVFYQNDSCLGGGIIIT
ncbi:MAG TPA: tRNA 2-thiouridine(34) synthase MnmA [Chloroflexi bacterium]|nr:tRNA 2-thiouridine(34) synthase MnmA [Chloroflexota bacterium]|tara:strand:+ start:2990 stop:4060 length:1071 start_codon:yes stop_codon:yes gene_type:complete